MDVLERAKSNFKKDKEAWRDNYEKAQDDLRFMSDDQFAQWDEKDYNNRVKTGRPALTINQLTQFVHQVANDIRMNTPTINVLPSDVAASQDTAEVLKGLIREIEYKSNADDVYDTASLNSVKCGIGFIRIDHDYEGDGFEQVLAIKRVVNPLAVYLDGNSIECDGRDAKRCTIIDHISVEDFKAKYPGKEPCCFENDDYSLKDGDMLAIAEVFEVEESPEEIVDGEKRRTVQRRKVMRYKMSGKDILEEGEFPSRWIPIVPVYGEETWVDGVRQLYSLIRRSKQAQQMFNLWKSLETEMLMKAPKAHTMAAVGQVEDFADDWINPDKAAVLRYRPKDADGNLVGAPTRLPAPQVPVGIINAARQTVDDIKATMGIYNASLGMVSNETSGIAIQRRQNEGGVATYHFADNLVRSITHVGRIIVDAIPTIYDTPRIIHIIGAEEETEAVGINGQLVEGQPAPVDLTTGKYDVRVTTGASFTTKRQEAAQFLSQLIQAQPDFIKIVGDLLFKNMDVSGSQAMAERIKKIMDPKILDEGQGVDPAVQQMQAQLQQSQALIAGLQMQLNDKQAELGIKAQSEKNDANEAAAKTRIDQEKLQFEREKFLAEITLKSRELALEEQKTALEVARMQAAPVQPQEGVIQNV